MAGNLTITITTPADGSTATFPQQVSGTASPVQPDQMTYQIDSGSPSGFTPTWGGAAPNWTWTWSPGLTTTDCPNPQTWYVLTVTGWTSNGVASATSRFYRS